MTDLFAPDTLIRGANGEYRIMSLIGRGGMGTVYRAQRVSDGIIWALKEMRPPDDAPPAEVEENRRLFEQEANLLRELQHPNLPVVADFFTYNNRPVLVMEYVPGETLEDRIRKANAPLSEQQAVSFGIQIARVLGYLHARKPPIIYRDLKPSNIMVTPENVIKLIDFGVARTYKVSKSKDTIAMGSAGYAPPEQYGNGQTDARSDIYALGATMLHLLTSLPPIPLQPPAPGSISKMNPSVDRQTEQVVIKAMALDRHARFRDVNELDQALQRCLDTPYVDPTTRLVPPVSVAPVAPPRQAPPAQPVTQVDTPPTGTPCQRCGRVNKSGARFCAGCGAPLGAAPVARLLITSPRASWERKIDRVPLRIGRRDPRQNHYPELDLAEHDRGIASRNHAVINRNGDGYTLTDLGSTNGTLLNGVPSPPHAPQRLSPGDRIKVGEVEMEFRWS